jgi:ferredoxin
MDQIIRIGLFFTGSVLFVGFAVFAIISHFEGEKRARRVSLFVALLGAGFFFLAAAFPFTLRLAIFGFEVACTAIFLLLFFLPVGKVQMRQDEPKNRVDERDIMFARARLEPDSPEYQAYYEMRPENKDIDERTRAKPGLLSPESRLANPFLFASPEGSFGLTEALHEAVDGPVSTDRQALPPEKMTAYLKGLAHYFGALDVGITELKPYHVYTHIGRGSGTYGAPIPIEHPFALAFTVEMDFRMLAPSPAPQVVMESGKQYVESARIAVQLANAIRYLGYSARAHIDGNYRVIAPLVARDADLGEIGRMGLIMTPKQGPRVRLGVVTTDVELIPDRRKPDPSVIDFCNICTKCAENCPSNSIPLAGRIEIDGVLRWKIDPETCFHYWNVIGTDCARCMTVCPYSHPDSFSHNLIRRANSRSGFFRRGANWLDDLFYGKNPDPRAAPEWTQIP